MVIRDPDISQMNSYMGSALRQFSVISLPWLELLIYLQSKRHQLSRLLIKVVTLLNKDAMAFMVSSIRFVYCKIHARKSNLIHYQPGYDGYVTWVASNQVSTKWSPDHLSLQKY